MLTWELVGAAVGAGFASGREIAVFFAQYGKWSFISLAAAGVMLSLSGENLPTAWKNHWPEKVWRFLLSMLLMTTGGAMLAAAGAIGEQVLFVRGSSWLSMAITLAFSWILAMKTRQGLSGVSRCLVTVLLMLLLLAFRVQPMQGAVIVETKWYVALLSGACYGGMNAALQWPIMMSADQARKKIKDMHRWATVLMLLMLLLGLSLMQRNAALMSETMPFLVLMKQFGDVGYLGFTVCLYLAVLSTLTSCIRAVDGRLDMIGGIVLVACGGFGAAIGHLYPMLGGCCCVVLLIAKIMNSFAASFHSGKDML